MCKTLYFFFAIILFGCSIGKKPDPSFEGLTIVQNNKRWNITDSTTSISILREPFEIEFTLLPFETENQHAFQIAACTDETKLKHFTPGPINYFNPYFGKGTGYAPPKKNQPYEYLLINDVGHHYIYYTDNINNRVTLLKKFDNGSIRAKWTIDSINQDKKLFNMKESNMVKLYLMCFMDKNLNNTIEAGEHHLITLTFPS